MDEPFVHAEHACAAVTTRFFHCLDRADYSGLAELMTEDGIWLRQGKELTGRGAILEALRARPADLSTRHLVSNIVVDVLSPFEARVAYELSVYAKRETDPARHRSIMTGEDILTRDAWAWRIRMKKAEPFFEFHD